MNDDIVAPKSKIKQCVPYLVDMRRAHCLVQGGQQSAGCGTEGCGASQPLLFRLPQLRTGLTQI